MKETILAIALVLVIVLAAVLGAVFLFSADGETTEQTEVLLETTAEPTTQPTEQTTQPTTAAPTEETTEEPTEASTAPQTELTKSDFVYIVNSVRMETFEDAAGEIYVEAAAYVDALGLDADGTAHQTDKDRVQLSSDKLTVDDVTYSDICDGKLYVPSDAIISELGYPVWVDDEYHGTYVTTARRPFDIPQDVNVPVLMYHAVSDDCWGYAELFVSPSSMEEQLKYLVDNGYDPIWFEDLAHVEDYDKPVILTFDDGYDDNYTELLPLLEKYNVKATVFVIGRDFVNIAHKMNEEQIRAMSDSGLVSIQSHSYTHGDLSQMDEDTLQYEMNQTNKVIARITGKVPYVLCYPSGDYSSLTIDVAKEHYLFGLKMVGGLYNTSLDNPYEVSRYYIARSTDIYTFASYISSAG